MLLEKCTRENLKFKSVSLHRGGVANVRHLEVSGTILCSCLNHWCGSFWSLCFDLQGFRCEKNMENMQHKHGEQFYYVLLRWALPASP